MLANLSWKEYVSWQVFYSNEPFPEERADLRNALLVSTMINLKRGKKKMVQIKDFIPDFWNEKRTKQAPEEIIKNAKLIHSMITGISGGRKEKKP